MTIEKKIEKYLRTTTELSKVSFVVKKLVEHMNDLCERCQSDRIVCALRPLCDREYLNLLIDATVDEKLYPKFCYSLQKKEVISFLHGKSTIKPMHDIKLAAIPFLEILFGKRNAKSVFKLPPKEFAESIMKKLSEFFGEVVYSISEGKIFWVTRPQYYIFRYDLNKKVFSINMDSEIFGSVDEIIEVTKLLCKLNKVDCFLFSTAEGLMYMKIFLEASKNLEPKDFALISREFQKEMSAFSDFVNIIRRKESEKDQIVIVISIFDESEGVESFPSPYILKNIFFKIEEYSKRFLKHTKGSNIY